MGKRIIQRRRGRKKGRYKAPSHRYKGKPRYLSEIEKQTGTVEDIIHDPGHTAPLAKIKMENGEEAMIIAPEGLGVGDKIKITDDEDEIDIGSIMPINKIPEGMPVYNVELRPGDGGKLARSGGNHATIVSHNPKKTVIKLPSGKFKSLNSSCKATIGVTAGGGRKDKPFLKAGKKYIVSKAKGKLYPVVRGVAMNPVDHPHGGGGHQHVGKSTSVKRSSPPGKKVGSAAPKKTGKE